MFRRLTPLQWCFDLGVGVASVLLRVAIGLDDPVPIVAVVALGAAFALRRFSPAVALGVAWLAAGVQLLASLPPDVADLAILPVLYATAHYGSRVVRWVGLASAVLGAVVAAGYLTAGDAAGFAPTDDGSPPRAVLVFCIYLAAAAAALVLSWTLGLLAKTWAAAKESRQQQALAEQKAHVEQQRNRIARDMHDVVAHSLAVVIAQADGARYASAADPGAAQAALTSIAATAREALADVRVLLAELRHEEVAGPQPALTDLGRLFERLRAAGLPVTARETGLPAALPSGQQLAIYRVVQEALVNALRHGDEAHGATVSIAWGRESVAVHVVNTLYPGTTGGREGPGGEGHRDEGHGIAGMRERALLAGGTLTAGPVGGTFAVGLVLPTPHSAPDSTAVAR